MLTHLSIVLLVMLGGRGVICTTSAMPTCPSACYCDDSWIYVNCVGDGLWQVPPDIPVTVTRLELRNYVMGTLASTHVSGLSNLTELKLQQTQIERIENSTFDGLFKLTRLDLSQNLLENLTQATFSGLASLRYLDLSTNQLKNVDGTFNALSNVEQLNLRDNKLQHLTLDTFVGLQRVQYLNLDSNAISTIDVGTFQSLTHLVHLILSNNPLSNLTRLDFFSARLLYIDVSHVGLIRVPQSLTQMVRDLRLAKNNLTHIRRGDFDSYPHLGLLVLDDNLISEIESDALGRQESLLRLWLNGNLLQKVPSNLPISLRTLYIEENQLESLPPFSFQGLTNIEQLFLQRNKLKILSPCSFCDLLSLRSLDLQSNLIQDLQQGIFANLSKLESLDLSQNPLRILGYSCLVGIEGLHNLRLSRIKTTPQFDVEMLDNLKRLQIVELYDSPSLTARILNSSRVLHALRNVRELNLMHNNIASLRSDFAHFFPQLREIKMSGNVWHCDVDILWMTEWMKKAEVQFYRSYSIRCATPPELGNKPIMMLTKNDFPINPTTTAQAATMTTTTTTTTPTTTTTSTSTTPKPTPTTHPTTTTTPPTTTTPTTTTTTQSTTTTTTTKLTTTIPTTTMTTALLKPSTTKTTTIPESPTPTTTKKTPPTKTTKPTTPSTTTTTTTSSTTRPSSTTLPTTRPSTSEAKPSPPDNNESSITSETTVGKEKEQQTLVIVVTSLASGILLVILGSAAALLAYRCHQGGISGGGLDCPVVRRNGSISYSPQRDEVNFVTVSEGTVGLKTATHHGLGNKLYFVMESGHNDVTLADADLHELMPQTEEKNSAYPYGTT